jgi:hypothetical protein
MNATRTVWAIEWTPDGNFQWGVLTDSVHADLDKAQARLDEIMASTQYDHDESHWRIIEDY